MQEEKTQRLRDPIHGLIIFDKKSPVDQLAWKLLNTPEFQRLRRIRQLGVSEFVYPGATHTRFAHSIGVFHMSRKLCKIIERETSEDKAKADRAVLAALLHDIGHGPFSHTFEGVQKKRGVGKKHEQWSADIIANMNGEIRPLLEKFRKGIADEISNMLVREIPDDIYDAIVSSSFDADRLDYLQRDRYMTGTKAGAIDYDWLTHNLRVKSMNIGADDSEIADLNTPVFCFDQKALPAAEQFLLARYTLHQQVYFHKTTRCVEHMIAKLLFLVSEKTKNKNTVKNTTGLGQDHSLIHFFREQGNTVENYLALDDLVLTASFHMMKSAQDEEIRKLAKRIIKRELYKSLALEAIVSNEGKRRSIHKKIKNQKNNNLFKGDVLIDEGAKLKLYTTVSGEDEKEHKKMNILYGYGNPIEITSKSASPMLERLEEQPKELLRYYFENESDRITVQGWIND